MQFDQFQTSLTDVTNQLKPDARNMILKQLPQPVTSLAQHRIYRIDPVMTIKIEQYFAELGLQPALLHRFATINWQTLPPQMYCVVDTHRSLAVSLNYAVFGGVKGEVGSLNRFLDQVD